MQFKTRDNQGFMRAQYNCPRRCDRSSRTCTICRFRRSGIQGPTTRDSGAWIISYSDYSIAVQSDNIIARTHKIMNRRGRAAQRSKRSSALRMANSIRDQMRMYIKHTYRTSPLNLSHFGCALVRKFQTSARAER